MTEETPSVRMDKWLWAARFYKTRSLAQKACDGGKVEVNGDGACPLYKHLTALDAKPKGPGKISWNFEKFIVGRSGQVVARFAPRTKPDDPAVLKTLEAELAKE